MANIKTSILSLAVLTIMCAHVGNGQVAIGVIGATCDGYNKLCIQNAECFESRCRCKDGFVAHESQRSCLEETKEWEGPCSSDAQCHQFDGAVCANGACDCRPDHHFVEGKCWTTRKLNEECTEDNECFLDVHQNRIECSGGRCECRDGFHITDTGDDCSGASELWKVGLTTLLIIHAIKSVLI